MINKIKILSEAMANRIAAGEVVSRPESVVKELIENSIDAGASQITLIIKDAGKSLIQVVDNGSGMSKEDAEICFQRHTTSKIYNFDDLDNIRTLGFRGEALASIASVSQIELKTRTIDSELGYLVRIDGSNVVTSESTSTEKGTSISVKNIFYNTPGRRNFLKSNQTEFKHIYDTFIRLAVSHPDIEFVFYNNDESIFNLPASTIEDRLINLYSEEFFNSLIKVDKGNSLVSLRGFISKPAFVKKSKQDQIFYLNNRYFTNKNLTYAVYAAYDQLIEKGDYPSFFLFIDIDTSKVDVNVHPSKLEVKFENEGAIFGLIRGSIRDTLRDSDLTFNVGFDNAMQFSGEEDRMKHVSGIQSSGSSSDYKPSFEMPKSNYSPLKRPAANIHSFEEIVKTFTPEKSAEEIPEVPQERIFEHTKQSDSDQFAVWQFKNKYIMCQTQTGLMIIDQHAAHERILYEKAVLLLKSRASFSQQLLMPIELKLTKIDFELAKELKSELSDLGFNFNIKNNDVIELTGIPSDVLIGDENKIFTELLDQYKEYEQSLHLEKRDNLAKSFACRSAIKTGQKLTQTEMLNLIDTLFAANMPYVCPHGRPTVIRITTDELDKRFSRT
jgi:DNA mismatch repair protein MutL